jgi:hypothetical protein
VRIDPGFDPAMKVAFEPRQSRRIPLAPSPRWPACGHPAARSFLSFAKRYCDAYRNDYGWVGVMQALCDFATSQAPTDGFRMLIERNMPELTGEALVLKHKGSFDPDVVAAVKA